jgi:NADH-quinone oxidoreductase subunit L
MTVLVLLVIALPWAGALLVLLFGDSKPRAQHTAAVIFVVATGGAALGMIPGISSDEVFSFPMGAAFGALSFVPDALGVSLTVTATVVGSLAVIFSVDYMRGEAQLGRYYSLMLFFIGAMAGLVLSSNILFLFLFWEITALCSYALISFNNDDPKAVYGGMKALVITQLGGVGLLLFAVLGITYVGTYDVHEIILNAHSLPVGILAFAAYGALIAAAAKSSQFPFHTWLPDAMEAPTPISALIHAATMVNAGVYLLARFYPAFKGVPGWTTAVILVGMISALLAGMMALFADDLKRVLAYSTVSQLGYMVYAVGTGGIFASQMHLISHSVFKALLFLSAGAVIHAAGTRDMRLMGGLGKKMPFTRAVFVLGALALAGIPILNGFWSKELILEAGLESGNLWAYGVMVFTAGLTALYTFRCVWLVFFGEPRSDLHGHDAGKAMKVSLTLLALGSLTTWLLAGVFSRALHETLPLHEIHFESVSGMAVKIFSSPATFLALGVIGLGLIAWLQRSRLAGVARGFAWLSGWSDTMFGFEPLNLWLAKTVRGGAEALRGTQTGLLQWNIAGILTGLLVILAVLVFGGVR